MTKQKIASAIWDVANEMRGNIDASRYKDYILGFIFYKFLSVKLVSFINDLWCCIKSKTNFYSLNKKAI